MEEVKLSRRKLTKHMSLGAAFLLSPLTAQAALKQALPTPAQVEGPFHPIHQQADTDLDLTRIDGRSDTATGEIILVRGVVMGLDGEPLANAVVDVWQANHHGRYAHPGDLNTAPLDPAFQGWGVVKTDASGRYAIKTIKPAPYPLAALGGQGWRCSHIHFKVSKTRFSTLTTQMYFRGDPLLDQDLEIAKVVPAQRDLLITDAVLDSDSGLPLHRFDLVLGNA